jgi:hypothetical protein
MKSTSTTIRFEPHNQRFLAGEGRERIFFPDKPDPFDLVKSHIKDPLPFRFAVLDVPPAPLRWPSETRAGRAH